jgi:CDP-ribitol ribitolphosphotransferase
VRSAVVTLRTLAVRIGFWLGSARRPAPRVVLATSHAAALSGNLAYLAEELAARRPAIPVTVLASRHEPGVAGRVRSLVAAARAGYLLAAARAFVVDDYFFPMYVITPRPGTVRLQVWHAAGAFKKFGYSVLDRSFGADEAFVEKVAIHANYSLALVSSMSVAPHYAEAFGQPIGTFSSRYGLPRTDRLPPRPGAAVSLP